MCIAIVVPAGKVLSEEVFTKCAASHRHGMGFAYVDENNEVKIEKRENSGDQKAVKAFFRVYANTFTKGASKHPMIIHFRTSTGGTVSHANAHPFKLKSGGALIHNGYFFTSGSPDSDTHRFVAKYGELLTKEFVDANVDKISQTIGSWNKVAILWPDGSVSVLCKAEWNSAECGTLFSNTSWKK